MASLLEKGKHKGIFVVFSILCSAPGVLFSNRYGRNGFVVGKQKEKNSRASTDSVASLRIVGRNDSGIPEKAL